MINDFIENIRTEDATPLKIILLRGTNSSF